MTISCRIFYIRCHCLPVAEQVLAGFRVIVFSTGPAPDDNFPDAGIFADTVKKGNFDRDGLPPADVDPV
jgi:hypothetical protein